MRILVTGSSGFIARFLIPALASNGHSVVGMDKRLPEAAFGDYFTFVHGNILDERKVMEAARGIDMIIHLAAEHQDFGVPEKLYYDVNVGGTKTLLKHAGLANIENFIFYSSVAVYGANTVPSHEDMPPCPSTPYGRSKLMAEEEVLQWSSAKKGRKTLVIRPAVIFGPYNYANMYRLISSIARRTYLKVGDGTNIKSVGYVENIVAATLFLLERLRPGFDVYNYADSPHLKSHEMASIIAGELDVRLPGIMLPKNLALALCLPFDLLARITRINLPITSARIKKFTTPTHHLADKIIRTGFTPPFKLQEGLKKMVNWYKVSESKNGRRLQAEP